jgi:hypothetical protein
MLGKVVLEYFLVMQNLWECAMYHGRYYISHCEGSLTLEHFGDVISTLTIDQPLIFVIRSGAWESFVPEVKMWDGTHPLRPMLKLQR